MFNRLMRRSGLLLAARVEGEEVAPFVHQPNESSRAAWALWWCFYLGEISRLRRCEECQTWFRDRARSRNQRRCTKRCERRATMRAYRRRKREKKSRPRQIGRASCRER